MNFKADTGTAFARACQLGDLLDFRNEIVHPKDRPTGSSIFVGLEHIERDTGVRIGADRIDLSQLTGRRARFYAGDIVYGYLRPYLNKVWIAEFDGICSVDQYVFIVRPEADRDYIARFLRSDQFLRTAPIDSTPGQLPRIRSGEIAATPILLPSLDEQRRIANILEKADRLRRNRKRAINLIGRLAPSLFLELFGSSAKERCEFKSVLLEECCTSSDYIRCGPFGTQLYQSDFRHSGVPLWGIKHVNAHFNFPTVEFLSIAKATELSNYDLVPGDLVMTRKGTIGNVAVYPSGAPNGVMHSDLLRVRLNQEFVLPQFMAAQLRYDPTIKRQIALISGGAIMAGINVGKLKSIKVFVPPIKLQKEFVAVTTQARSLSALQSKDLHLREATFHSLQSRAFSGRL